MEYPLVPQAAQARMRMNDVHALPEDNRAQVREKGEEVWQSCVGGYRRKWDVVHFDAGVEVADANVRRGMRVGDNDDLVAK